MKKYESKEKYEKHEKSIQSKKNVKEIKENMRIDEKQWKHDRNRKIKKKQIKIEREKWKRKRFCVKTVHSQWNRIRNTQVVLLAQIEHPTHMFFSCIDQTFESINVTITCSLLSNTAKHGTVNWEHENKSRYV